jgi:hypothetical protein
MDQDPGITVELAEDAAEGALRLVIYDQVFTVTARSMVDLIHKANIALQDWIAVVFTELVELPEPQEPVVVGQASLPDWLTPEELERFAAAEWNSQDVAARLKVLKRRRGSPDPVKPANGSPVEPAEGPHN